MISILPEHAPGNSYEELFDIVVEDYVFYTVAVKQFDEKVAEIARDISDQLSVFGYLFDETKIIKEVVQQLRVRHSTGNRHVCEKSTTKLLECIYDIFCK